MSYSHNTIGDRANLSTVHGPQFNNHQSGTGTQNNNNSTGTQNINHGRDQNFNNGPGGMTVNNKGPWNPRPPQAYHSPSPSSGYGNSNNNREGTQNVNTGRDQNANNSSGKYKINNDERTGRDSPPPTQHSIAGSATRERRGDAHSPSIAPARPPSEKRLNGDKLRREEDHFRDMRDDEDEYEEVLGIKNEDAQKVLDEWQSLFECTEDTKLRQQVVRAMSELAYRIDFGGFADIWTGSTDGKKVAVKVVRYRIDREQRDQMMKAFMREAVIWRSFDHPNILPLMGMYWFNSEQICLVCPWMENGNLLQFVKKHPDIDSATQEELAKEIAQGLAYLHGLNITHGDLKGYNVLIDVDPDDPDRIAHARITDFGLSRVADDENLAGLSTMSGRQGPARWLAPELLTEWKKISNLSEK
ncbi:hypothetical protein AAF712_006444 [Marasmius tenuissimus]|uniref:Protein kinase domain-containing protein n=1 Tax=Marasmius tenuissimus TaxID=585030 RepID=A0ABR3A1G8_9AGAR